MPDPTQQLLVNNWSSTNQNNFTTATLSPTPPTDELILAAIYTHHQGVDPPAIPTLAGNSLTWVQVATEYLFIVSPATASGRITVFRAMESSGITSGAVTISHTASVHGCIWIISAIANLKITGTDGADAIHDSYVNSTPSAVEELTVTLDAFDDPANRPWAAFCATNRVVDLIAAGQTEIDEQAMTGERVMHTQWKPAGTDTTSRANWTSQGNSSAIGIALELAVDVAICDEATNKKRGSFPQFPPMTLAPCPDGTID